jgi:hypothetical protein
MHGMLGASASSPSEPCNAPLTVNCFRLFNEEILTSQWRDAALHGRHKSDEELPFLDLFLPIALVSTLSGQEHHDTGRQARLYHNIQGLPGLG